ncbi:MAG: Rpn family recombination-promoting nuclease/putative transposase [Lachnospiraceae bacterium]|nr:Rpn family recombination-promoting nuclease/putative transposase [Lachnospiraceae bacterium]
MATEKDTAMGDLEALNDVFSDIMNVLMFKGERYVGENDLEQGREKSSYDSDSAVRLRPQYRDIHKFWKNCEVRIAYVGMENETEPEDDMPFRTIGYDGAAYRDQISYYTDEEGKRRKSKERYPVITLVLYMGYKRRWDRAKSIYEALGERLDDRLKPFVQNYRINLFEIAFLEEEDVELFQSDFRIVADYLVQMRKNNDYKPTPFQIRHVREVLNTMAALMNNAGVAEIYAGDEKGDEPKTMSDVFERAEKRGRKAGQMEITKLMNFLLTNGRSEDAIRATNDEGFLNKLLAEFNSGLMAAK